jgi:hypothetical protein
MKIRISAILILFSGLLLYLSGDSSALSTDQLLQLKKAGVPEDIILLMTESDYKDVERVLKLKETGFKDETIRSIIKNDLKGKPLPSIVKGEKAQASTPAHEARFETASRIKILWYLIYRGEPVLQNSQAVDDARMSIMNGGVIKYEWKEGGNGLLDIFVKKSFESPFFWDIDKADTFGPGEKGYAYVLKSTVNHKGKPDTNGSHYWMVYFDPKDPKIVDYLRQNLHM